MQINELRTLMGRTEEVFEVDDALCVRNVQVLVHVYAIRVVQILLLALGNLRQPKRGKKKKGKKDDITTQSVWQ